MGILTQFQQADVFIETGLGHGQSLRLALQQPFDRLHSIEIDPTLIGWFAAMPEGKDPRLTLHLGSSPDVLPRICDPARLTMVWLDAHYSAGQYTSDSAVDRGRLDPRFGQCPLLAELAILRAVPWVAGCRPWIYIDDAACFLTPAYEGMLAQHDRAAYPTEAEIRAALPDDYTLDLIDLAGAAYRATPKERS